MEIKNYLHKRRGKSTLLGICPMTEEIVKAAIAEAKDTSFTPMFIATPRQVDADRGYTGWSQEDLVEFIDEVSNQYRYEGDWILARDHGGPYQSFRDRGKDEVPTSRAMEYARELFYRDVRAGFDVIHVDATEDPGVDGRLSLSEIASRTAELILSIEDYIEKKNLQAVNYEVGTEEIVGGMTDSENFEKFVKLLGRKIGSDSPIDRILFVVGQVGTTMRIDMTNDFDRSKAKELVKITSSHDTFLKVHYTDWLGDSVLSDFPEIGIGAANVGPEFAASLLEGLVKVEREETRLLEENGSEEERSNFFETLKTVAVEKAPWKKFAPSDIEGQDLEDFAENNRENIAFCVGRYVLTDPEVKGARGKLYENVRKYSRNRDIEERLIEEVKDSIHRYVTAFNLDSGS
ncbi:MAG: class II D-tagatose-bisphosphate aldolase, non-catalytic subunit [Candidatus Bipolaricaulota bacterium]|nr:class II D-tagatose-bisphosphate aldolase, non-catalytic subunit [Candidatus Bipolaricaulota bacterium]MBS3791329.1 class II D-tagatose-bisphosphate aldolase, non-catalytic subunit [Candidatus Bipolaricaulota bacterium]